MKEQQEQQIKQKPFTVAFGIGFLAGTTEAMLTNPLVTIKSCRQRGVTIPWAEWFPHGAGIPTWSKNSLAAMKFLYRGSGARIVAVGSSVGVRLIVPEVVKANGNQNNSFKQEFATLLAAGFVSSVINTPMELGMALQQTADPTKKTANLIKTLRQVYSRFGFRKGFTALPAICARDATITSGFMTITPAFRDHLSSKYKINEQAASLLGGTVIGTCLSFLTHPLDTLKTMQQTELRESANKDSSSAFNVARKIMATRGVSGFYNGLFFRAARVGPHVGIVSSVNALLSDAWSDAQGNARRREKYDINR